MELESEELKPERTHNEIHLRYEGILNCTQIVLMDMLGSVKTYLMIMQLKIYIFVSEQYV